ncbi:hypothetical protein KQX54_007435 [Cotesia glomerata]|uniref:Uncharacterized protein n=1 Tax=Cotesia glomerata TaxID=32391 RepID=A0AAV7HQ18_COTGL|nr:hypothetical protein KQX54_007435 [Cotesia glomerata]
MAEGKVEEFAESVSGRRGLERRKIFFTQRFPLPLYFIQIPSPRGHFRSQHGCKPPKCNPRVHDYPRKHRLC